MQHNLFFSQLCTSSPRAYSSALSVLSEEIVLLFHVREMALELCRLSNIDDREKASLENGPDPFSVFTSTTSGEGSMWFV
jgi:hypothetical protein